MHKKPISIQKTVLLAGILAFLGVCLNGCSQIIHKNSKNKSKSSKTEQQTLIKQPSNMTADMMYKVLLAEMLIKRRQYRSSFQILYPLAVETNDIALVKKVFHLSIKTFDINSIEAATNLWLEYSPDDALPWKSAYLLDVRSGRVKEAKQKWKKYVSLSNIKLAENFIETSVRVSTSVVKEFGLDFLKSLQKDYPNEPVALFALGLAAEEYNEYDLAISKLEKFIEISEKVNEKKRTNFYLRLLNEAYYSLANNYLKTERVKKGLKKIGNKVLKDPKNWRLQEALAKLEIKAGLLLRAEKRYKLIVSNKPQATTPRLSLALIQMENINYISAKNNFLKLRKNKIYFAIATYYLGFIAQNQGLDTKAVNYYSQINSQDFYIDAQIRILEINYPKNGLEKTLQKINLLEAKTKENNIKLYRALAVFYRYENKLQQAVKSYQNALDLSPYNTSILLAQAYIFYELNKFKQYEKNLLTALKLEPNNVDALNALGYYYVEQTNKLSQATILLEKANRLEPNSFYIIDSLGWLFYKKNEFEKSEYLLEKAFSLEKDVEVLLHLMQVKLKLNKKDEASKLGNKYLEKFKDNNAELKKLLKNIKN